MIKKFLIIILCIFLAGCYYQDSGSSEEELKIVSTIFPGYDFARAITGADTNITLLLKPGSEAHTYDPTPKDIMAIEEASIFIYVGGESDSWIDKILNEMDTTNMKIIRMMDYVDLEEEHDHDHKHEHEGDHYEYDEHVWTSPVNAIKITESIRDVIIEVDPDNKTLYLENSKSYIEDLKGIDTEIREVVDNASRKALVFGDRFPLKYFADEYGLTYVSAYPGCSSETEISAKKLSELTEFIKDNQIPVVFYIELSNRKVSKIISSETGSKELEFQTIHNITKENFDNGLTYIDLMKKNIEVLKEALN